ncbi:hypothetical protein [Bordetella sp. BOR01]|uniref:hypothetical protein n=1 Tax=Bordetella sp. BOR01 TaxID=2854779 RepID=UPI001C44AC3D|nr:hypothetical protein [Bordetella sp. BOR01]MBV7483237.1 hypothetical protein [Bordetella sp. BOR01]
MSTHLVLDFSTSDYIATGALIVSIISAVYAKRQSRSADFASHNSYRAHLAEHHQVYRQALRESRQANRGHLNSLAELAGSTLTEIVELVDRFDTQRSPGTSERPLRHVLLECAEMVFYAFKGQLAWQTGLNISMRIYRVSQIEFDLDPAEKNLLGSNFRQVFEQQHLDSPNVYQEIMLAHDPYFCSLVTQLRTRIDHSRFPEWTSSVQQKLAPFAVLHESKSSILKAAAESLEEVIDEGHTQHFPLPESPSLYASLRRQKTILDTLSYLNIPQISKADAHHYSNYASIGVAICATMLVVINSRDWGWGQWE